MLDAGSMRTSWRQCWVMLLSIVVSACAGNAPPSDDDAPPPPPPAGVVLEPEHGAVIGGDTAGITIHVAGIYEDSTRPLAVQVLANPDDLASWETIATTTATEPQGDAFAFAVDVQPVASEDQRVRWPHGGVLRLRVIDDAGAPLPYDPADPTTTVVAVANPSELPATWTYLSEKPIGSVEETIAYYAAINAPPTLTDFQARFGFPANESAAQYYNAGDLGIARDMHCRTTETPAGGLACYVRNYGIFGGNRDEAIALMLAAGAPLATVAMLYTPPIDAPNAVQFFVYGPDGALVNEAQLDTRGDNKSIPQNCLNCHGGRSRYDVATHSVINARFLPFDPAAFAFSTRPDLTLAAQEDKLRSLNRLVDTAAPTAAIHEEIEGMFPVAGTPYDPTFTPEGWKGVARDERVYHEVVAPYCRGCHSAFENGPADTATFATAAGFRARASSSLQRACGVGPKGMPTAEATTGRFFSSSARALLLTYLEAPGACAP
jgi:hypothetical protein